MLGYDQLVAHCKVNPRFVHPDVLIYDIYYEGQKLETAHTKVKYSVLKYMKLLCTS